MTENTVLLSIVIVNYNSMAYLRRCLKSIRDTAAEIPHEIIVVDNNSMDASVAMMREEFPDIHLVANRENLGFTRGNNQGIHLSRGAYVLLLNNDTIVLPGAFQTMLAIMDASPGIGLLGCRLLNADGTLQQSFGKRISFLNDFGRKYFINLYEKRKNPWVGKFLAWRHSFTQEADWVKGACMLFRRQALFDAGLLDENIFMFMEEVDLSLRIKELGWKVVYTPKAEIIHIGGVSTATNNYKTLIEYRKSQMYFYKKHYGPPGLARIRFYLYVKMSKGYWWTRLKERLGWGDPKDLAGAEKFCLEILDIVRNFR